MRRPTREKTQHFASQTLVERRETPRLRADSIPALLTDINRERIPVVILNMSRSGIGVKVEERFPLDFPVLLECDGLLIVGNVRHCVEATPSGYILGLKIYKVVDAAGDSKSELSAVAMGAGC
jgi:hypothetical protein